MRAQYFRGNVFVANLPPDLSEDQLAEAFDPFGIVLSAFIARDPETGRRLRYGFVDIATEKAAQRAIEAMNGAALAGHTIEVSLSERRKEAKKQVQKPAGRRPAAHPPRPASAEDGAAGFTPPRPGRPSAEEGAAGFTPRPPPRRQPSFQVERRSLPRRV